MAGVSVIAGVNKSLLLLFTILFRINGSLIQCDDYRKCRGPPLGAWERGSVEIGRVRLFPE